MNFEEMVTKVAEAKMAYGDASIALGKVLSEAKQVLGKAFNKFLEDSRVNIKRTQANKSITFYEYSQKCQSTDTLVRLGIEKVCILSTVEVIEQQKQLQDYALSNTTSVSELKKIAAKMKEDKELTPDVAYDEVQKEKEEAKANKKQESSEKQGLKEENEALQARVNELEEAVAKLTAELQQHKQETITKTSKLAEEANTKPLIKRGLIQIKSQENSIANAS